MSSPRSKLIIVSGGYLTGKSGGLRGKDNDGFSVSLHLHSVDNDYAASSKALQSELLSQTFKILQISYNMHMELHFYR